MTFAEWIEFEADRIATMARGVAEQHRADYIKVQVIAALKKAYAHGKDGLSAEAEPRPHFPSP